MVPLRPLREHAEAMAPRDRQRQPLRDTPRGEDRLLRGVIQVAEVRDLQIEHHVAVDELEGLAERRQVEGGVEDRVAVQEPLQGVA